MPSTVPGVWSNIEQDYQPPNYMQLLLLLLLLVIIIIIIITKIYIAHMPDSIINRQIESEAHKKVDLTNV